MSVFECRGCCGLAAQRQLGIRQRTPAHRLEGRIADADRRIERRLRPHERQRVVPLAQRGQRRIDNGIAEQRALRFESAMTASNCCCCVDMLLRKGLPVQAFGFMRGKLRRPRGGSVRWCQRNRLCLVADASRAKPRCERWKDGTRASAVVSVAFSMRWVTVPPPTFSSLRLPCSSSPHLFGALPAP